VLADRDTGDGVRVASDREAQALQVSRAGATPEVLARGRFRHPRLSPDGRRVAVEWWSGRSWDIRVIDLADGRGEIVASGPGNETEPSWTRTGDALLFASDAGRGLGSTAAYCGAVDNAPSCRD
jgi:Tol biopolymer transport system component